MHKGREDTRRALYRRNENTLFVEAQLFDTYGRNKSLSELQLKEKDIHTLNESLLFLVGQLFQTLLLGFRNK
jgi:hypothetical protein